MGSNKDQEDEQRIIASRMSGLSYNPQSSFYASSRDSIAKKMTPDQLAEAQKQAREWMDAFEKRRK
jgi:hypothetical protein